MPSEYSPAGGHSTQEFPEIEARIGENPARFLDYDVLGSTAAGESKPSLMLEARIQGIDYLDVCIAYLAVETQLDREECPRSGVMQLLEERKAWLKDHGDRPRGGRVDHDAVPQTESVVTWDTDDGEQRTVASPGGRT